MDKKEKGMLPPQWEPPEKTQEENQTLDEALGGLNQESLPEGALGNRKGLPYDPKTPYQSDTPPSKRLWAWVGVIAMVILTLVYAYSIATGKIFAW